MSGSKDDETAGKAPVKPWEFRLMHEAIINRWPISDEVRARVVECALQILNDPACENKRTLKLRAIKVLVAMDRLNLEAQQVKSLSTGVKMFPWPNWHEIPLDTPDIEVRPTAQSNGTPATE